jgi:ATP-dependent DNA helicase RecQ
LTKRDAEQVAGWLNQKGITARAYYSGVETQDELNSEADSDRYRQHLESLLYNNEVKALVATTALGSSMP